MIQSLLVAVDGSDAAGRALDLAADLAARCGASLVLLHVQSPAAVRELAAAHAQFAALEHSALSEAEMARAVGAELLAQAELRARAAGATSVETQQREGEAAEQILDVAAICGADIVVTGRRGLGRVAELMLGSVSHEVAQKARCACLTVS